MKKKCKCFTTESQLYTKEDDMQEMRDRKAIRHIENKQPNDRSLFLSVLTLNVNGLNCSVKRQ